MHACPSVLHVQPAVTTVAGVSLRRSVRSPSHARVAERQTASSASSSRAERARAATVATSSDTGDALLRPQLPVGWRDAGTTIGACPGRCACRSASRTGVGELRTQVGGSLARDRCARTDLGVVDAREASSYFFSLVPRLEMESSKDRLLVPACAWRTTRPVHPAAARAGARRQARGAHAAIGGDVARSRGSTRLSIPALVDTLRGEGDDDARRGPARRPHRLRGWHALSQPRR